MYCANNCSCPYAVENSGDGPFAFTIRCHGCAADFTSHLPGCPGVLGHGILHRGGGVDVISGDAIRRFDSCADAYEDYDRRGPVEFVWGPINPEASLSFY